MCPGLTRRACFPCQCELRHGVRRRRHADGQPVRRQGGGRPVQRRRHARPRARAGAVPVHHRRAQPGHAGARGRQRGCAAAGAEQMRHAQSADKETKRRVQGAIAVSSFATAALAQVDKKKSVAGSLKAGEANFVTGVALGASRSASARHRQRSTHVGWGSHACVLPLLTRPPPPRARSPGRDGGCRVLQGRRCDEGCRAGGC